jgi:hypothetical protein
MVKEEVAAVNGKKPITAVFIAPFPVKSESP